MKKMKDVLMIILGVVVLALALVNFYTPQQAHAGDILGQYVATNCFVDGKIFGCNDCEPGMKLCFDHSCSDCKGSTPRPIK